MLQTIRIDINIPNYNASEMNGGKEQKVFSRSQISRTRDLEKKAFLARSEAIPYPGRGTLKN